jgi:hypothetical protein
MRVRKNPMTPLAAVVTGLLGGRKEGIPGCCPLPEVPSRRRDREAPGLGVRAG